VTDDKDIIERIAHASSIVANEGKDRWSEMTAGCKRQYLVRSVKRLAAMRAVGLEVVVMPEPERRSRCVVASSELQAQ